MSTSLHQQCQDKKCPKENANWISILLFWWVNPILRLGYKRDLELCDIPKVLSEDESEKLGNLLEIEWNKQLAQGGKHPLGIALLKVFGAQFALYGFLTFFEECFLLLLRPIVLVQLIYSFSVSSNGISNEVLFYSSSIFVISFLYTLSHHVYFFELVHAGMKVKIACSSLIYKKALKLSNGAVEKTSIGNIVNLMANDVEKFNQVVFFIHYIWCAPLQLLFVLTITWAYLGVSILGGLLIILPFIPIQSGIGKIFSTLRLQIAQKTDKRIQMMSEIISGIKVIKMYAWENLFRNVVHELRRQEIEIIKKSFYFKAFNMTYFLIFSRVVLIPVLALFILMGPSLSAENIFLTLSFYNTIRVSLTLFFPNAISLGAESATSIHRIQSFLLSDEQKSLLTTEKKEIEEKGNKEEKENKEEENEEEEEKNEKNEEEEKNEKKEKRCNQTGRKESPRIELRSISGKWFSDAHELTLENISLKAQDAELIGIVGPVGSGKSSILQTILQEFPISSGSTVVRGTLSYCSQSPWVFSGTVKENILFGKPFESNKYSQVINAVALSTDLDQWSSGDETYIEERGANISGGQKARISLARCIYNEADIYLLDDPLSAVDSQVARRLFDDCILSYLRQKTVLLVTHQLQYLSPVNKIYLLNSKGQLVSHGTFAQLIEKSYSFTHILSSELDDLTKSSQTVQTKEFKENKSIEGSSYYVKDSKPVTGGENREKREKGSVKFKTYFNYFQIGAGLCGFVLLLGINILYQVLFVSLDLTLKFWANDLEEKNILNNSRSLETEKNDSETLFSLDWKSENVFYFGVYSSVVLGLLIVTLFKMSYFYFVMINSSKNLHHNMFEKLLRAPSRFFDTNPLGRILNRFSKDMGSIDEILPICFTEAVLIFLNASGFFFLIIWVEPHIIFPALVIVILFMYLRRYYVTSSRSIKRLDGILKSPVFSHLSVTLQGLSTIRATSVQPMLQKQFDNLQDTHSSAYFMYMAVNRWFGMCLDWIVTAFIGIVLLVFVFLENDVHGGDVGVALMSVLALVGMLQWGFRQSAEVENLMTSVERIMEYGRIPSEAPLESNTTLPSNWPNEGLIEFKDLTLRYSLESEPVLRHISFSTKAFEKIGIVGRTGAGKSSLISALFRLVEPQGSIFIDGINSLSLGLHQLRSKISIIPQDPLLFSGSLRVNMDPFSEFKDDEIWSALEHAQLPILEFKLGLETPMNENGSNLSVGQRQLVCLARAILRRNCVLVLDEATANVDATTDALIQETLRREFKSCTVFTIAHRLQTVIDSDRILVLENGEIVEFDHAHILLNNTNGVFSQLIKHTGNSSAERLKLLAEKNYTEKNNK